MKTILRRHSLLIGLVLMFLVTWAIDLSNSGVLPFRVPFAVGLLVGWGFIIVSLVMTGLTLDREGLAAFLKRLVLWRVDWKWYMAALLLPPALQFLSVWLTALLTGIPADYSHSMILQVVPLRVNMILLILPWFLFEVLTNGEEFGWRGYVLPRLQTKYNALVSSLIVGVIWSVWHLPKFIGSGSSSGHSFLWFTLFHLAASILYTWLFNSTRGSLLLVILFHAANNTAGIFLPTSFAAAGGIIQNLMIVLYVLAAVLITLAAGPENLSRAEAKQVQGRLPENSHEESNLYQQRIV